jgi:hypothetical protein
MTSDSFFRFNSRLRKDFILIYHKDSRIHVRTNKLKRTITNNIKLKLKLNMRLKIFGKKFLFLIKVFRIKRNNINSKNPKFKQETEYKYKRIGSFKLFSSFISINCNKWDTMMKSQ